jgi:hypothetical protein
MQEEEEEEIQREGGRKEGRKEGGKKKRGKVKANLQLFPNYDKYLFVVSLVGQK